MSERQAALANMHKLFLEALRHREQEIFRYLAILGPALSGFVWLLKADPIDSRVFVIGTVCVLLPMFLGAVYALALGYNYRYITLQIAKLESMLCIKDYMLKGWPKCRKDFLDRYKLFCCKPWCTPPEIIKVFWWAFLAGIAGVTLAACLYRPEGIVLSIVIPVGAVAFLTGLFAPLRFGKKLRDKCLEEPETWVCESASGSKDGSGEARQ